MHCLIASTPPRPGVACGQLCVTCCADPATAVDVIDKTSEPHTVNPYLRQEWVSARSEPVLAGPGNLRKSAAFSLRSQVFDRSTTTVCGTPS